MLVAVRLKVEIPRHFAKAFVADGFDMLLHEAIVVPPFDAGGAHGGLLGAGRDLMSVQIVQAELIDQRLLDFFVEDEKAIGLDRAATKFERPRHVPVDIDRLAVEAVAGQIRALAKCRGILTLNLTATSTTTISFDVCWRA